MTALRYAYWPIPGQAKIVSTSTVPVSTFANDPITVTTDGSAARSTYRGARSSGSPFARAART